MDWLCKLAETYHGRKFHPKEMVVKAWRLSFLQLHSRHLTHFNQIPKYFPSVERKPLRILPCHRFPWSLRKLTIVKYKNTGKSPTEHELELIGRVGKLLVLSTFLNYVLQRQLTRLPKIVNNSLGTMVIRSCKYSSETLNPYPNFVSDVTR